MALSGRVFKMAKERHEQMNDEELNVLDFDDIKI